MLMPTRFTRRPVRLLSSCLVSLGLLAQMGCSDSDTKEEASNLPDAADPLVVGPGERIQDAVAVAVPGDTIQILPGTYNEAVLVVQPNITIEGIVVGDTRPILDGQDAFENGVEVRPPENGEEWPGQTGGGPLPESLDKFTLSGVETRNYTDNGVKTTFIDNVHIFDVVTKDTGVYGIFPVLGTNILVEDCVTSGAWDTGVYVGQSRDVTVRNCDAFNNTSGIEVENCIGGVVEDNYTHDNTAGILVFTLPKLSIKEASNVVIRNNRTENNNYPNQAPDGAVLASVPVGTGILLLAADNVEITGNTIKDNQTMGIAMVSWSIFDLLGGSLAEDPEVEPNTDGTNIHDNTFEANGTDPVPDLLGVIGSDADIVWDGQGTNNCWNESAELGLGLVPLPKCE